MRFKDLDTTKFEYFCSRVAAGIGLLILGFLSVYTLLYTRRFESNHKEMPVEGSGNPVLTLALMTIVLLLMFYVVRTILRQEQNRERNLRILLVFTCIYAVVYGIVWAFACKYYMMWDPKLVSFWGEQLAHGIDDVSAGDIDYLTSYPHQIGLIAFLEQIYRIFGGENYHAFQILNAFGAGGIVFFGYRIIRMMTERLESAAYFLLLMLSCHPLYIYVSFVYGEVLSVMFSFMAVYALLCYLKLRRKRDILLLAFSLTAACLIRSNCYIVIAAVGCVLGVKMISEKTLKHGAAFFCCLALFFASHSLLLHTYEERLNLSLHDGMPSILWVAMGLQEGGVDDFEREAGWYNGFAWDVYVDESGRDQELSKERAREAIKESIHTFTENPSYGTDFFRRKITSQWAEPTYACLQETNRRVEARSPLMDSFYKGELWGPFVRVMDVYQSLIYCGAFLFLLLLIWKKTPVEKLGLFIVVIGGFIFYIFWEAKSRYVFPYFVMLIPMAACGWDVFIRSLASWKNKIKEVWRKRHPEKEENSEKTVLLLKKTETFSVKAILLLAGLPCAALFLYSLFFTTVYQSNDLELPSQAADNPLLMLLFTAAGVLAFYAAGRAILKKEENRRRNMGILLGAVLLHCAVFCTVWNMMAQSALRADPLYIHAIAGGFATGDVSPSGMDYLYTYPHQAGQALLLELVYRLFGYENLMAFRSLNTLGVLVFVFCGFKITEQLWHKDAAKVNFLLLSAGFLPLLIYTNVIYGEVLAVAGVSLAVWMFLLWLEEKKIWQAVTMLLALVFAVYMKNNALIAAVAIGCVMLCKAVSEKKQKLALWILPLIGVLVLAQPAMTKLYEYRSGWQLDQGMPRNLWAAMGLQGEGMTSGWWNEFPDKVYKEQAGYDPQAAKELGDAAITFSLEGFAEHPKAAVKFFGQKFVSQWNDASHGCQVSAGSQETPFLEWWMNGWHSLILFGAFAFALLWFKKKAEIQEVLPMLILLGGFLFHMVWEVKGRYGFFYFALLLPASAAGIQAAAETGRRLLEKRRKTNEKA